MARKRKVAPLDAIVARHRGGYGSVWFVHAINEENEAERVAVFSSIEASDAWMQTLPGEWVAMRTPLMVDHPDYGIGSPPNQ
jgi:hypothetical protein